ncbi:MAG: amidohydrolase family protein [Bacteroidales bacterium]|nr:amidohydrolase family protein [Bacteroidales bacterium]MBR0291607.1 amidohydrolase family protein [Bacteroidales bacterium]
MPTMLPGSSFFLGLPYGRAGDFIKAGLGIALASDYNPGSSPMGDMRFVMALACIKMRLTPVQALNAVTLNGTFAMGISDTTGSVTRGKRADLLLTSPGWTLTCIPYAYRTPFIRSVFAGGRQV